GLRNLTIIKWAVEVINERRAVAGEEVLDVNLLPLDDPAVFTLPTSSVSSPPPSRTSRSARRHA
ncbi:MAG: hypothetical protein KDC87_18030, partial [Planctomycetes bacterium]|nr:hypothetical protein [Planctomycetota bacterium]